LWLLRRLLLRRVHHLLCLSYVEKVEMGRGEEDCTSVSSHAPLKVLLALGNACDGDRERQCPHRQSQSVVRRLAQRSTCTRWPSISFICRCDKRKVNGSVCRRRTTIEGCLPPHDSTYATEITPCRLRTAKWRNVVLTSHRQQVH